MRKRRLMPSRLAWVARPERRAFAAGAACPLLRLLARALLAGKLSPYWRHAWSRGVPMRSRGPCAAAADHAEGPA